MISVVDILLVLIDLGLKEDIRSRALQAQGILDEFKRITDDRSVKTNANGASHNGTSTSDILASFSAGVEDANVSQNGGRPAPPARKPLFGGGQPCSTPARPPDMGSAMLM